GGQPVHGMDPRTWNWAQADAARKTGDGRVGCILSRNRHWKGRVRVLRGRNWIQCKMIQLAWQAIVIDDRAEALPLPGGNDGIKGVSQVNKEGFIALDLRVPAHQDSDGL